MVWEGNYQGLKLFNTYQTNAMCGPCLDSESRKPLKKYKTWEMLNTDWVLDDNKEL